MVIWFTGKNGAGKSTLAGLLQAKLGGVILDGDVVRHLFWPELTYTKEDRDKNVTRLSHLAHLLQPRTVIVAAISPYRRARGYARHEMVSSLTTFEEVYVKCDDAVLRQRDTKGLYRRQVDQGAYEPPEPEDDAIVIDTSHAAPTESVQAVLRELRARACRRTARAIHDQFYGARNGQDTHTSRDR